jgi:hypothetical protein
MEILKLSSNIIPLTMSAFSLRSYRKKNKVHLSKIAHVYDTKKKESVWIVKTVDGKRKKISTREIYKKKLLTPETTWAFDHLGFKFRYEVGKEKRYVFWKGFKDPTIEPGYFKPQVLESSEDEEEE